MPTVLEKVERRLGEKLLLKGERCVGPKCALTRRSYPPGAQGKRRRRRRGLSEYGTLLREKQKIRYLYGLDDKGVKRYVRKAEARPGVFSSNFLRLLESRLDNTVFRLGFAPSRRVARHLVSYGHISVNERTVRIPSYEVRRGDVVAIKERSRSSGLFVDLEVLLKRAEPPQWLERNPAERRGTVRDVPSLAESEMSVDVAKVKEFYSR